MTKREFLLDFLSTAWYTNKMKNPYLTKIVKMKLKGVYGLNLSINKRHLMERMLIIFIALQPVLDLLTSFSLHYLKTSLTFGLIVRTLMFGVTAVYIFYVSIKNNHKKILIYFVVLAVALVLNLYVGYQSKTTFNLVEEIKYITKTIYFILMLFSYYFVWDYIKNRKTDILLNKIVVGMLVVGIVMIVSLLTGTAIKSYTYGFGSKGWFSSGNEISAIMAICSPMVIIYSFNHTDTWKDFYKWLPSLVLLASSLIVGTKVGMISSFFFITVTIILIALQLFINSTNRKKLIVNAILSIFVLASLATLSQNTGAVDNLKQNNQRLEAKQQAEEAEAETGDEPQQETTSTVKTNKIIRLLLSSRDIFLVKKNNEFKQANVGQKLFGLGYSTTNENGYTKMIEMDFFDLFYSFGIIGFLIYLIPILYFMYSFLMAITKKGRSFFSFENILMFLGLIIGIGISVVAGHVFSAPAVSIYIAIIMVYLYKNNQYKTSV
ncbi:O-antigen ligase family protein [Neobacillus rhizosphaerae]|uniref:O-antigen ligase family protein n=1 Tax=Neobacillus rhizosphaerae TaxID=2880965 RepID=UPI003D287DDC